MAPPSLDLAALGRIVGALSAGALPTQKQFSALIDALVACPLFTPATTGSLSPDGQEIVIATKGLLSAVKELSDEKNHDDSVQHLVHVLAKAETVIASRGPRDLVAPGVSPSEDAAALLGALRTTFVLFVTSPTSRRLLGEMAGLVFELFAQIRQEAEAVVAEAVHQPSLDGTKAVLADATASAPKRAQQWADDTFPHEPEDALVERLQELVTEIRSDDRFVAAADAVVHAMEHYVNALERAVDATQEAIDEDSKAVSEAGQAFLDVLAAFLGREQVDAILLSLRGIVDECRKDKKLRDATKEMSRLFKRIFHDPSYVTTQRFGRRCRALRHSITAALTRESDILHKSLGKLQDDLHDAWHAFVDDPAVRKLAAAAARWTESFGAADALLKGPAAWSSGFMADLASFWVPQILEMILVVAIPRLEVVSPEWDVAVDGFSIQPPDSGFGPSLLRFATAGEAALTRPNPKSPHLESFAHSRSVFELKGVRAFAKSVSIYIRRKQGWLRLEEEALLDLVLGFTEHDGLNVRIETDLKAGALVGETQWDIRSAEVKLNGLSIYARSATHHPLLSRLVLPTVERVARQSLESALEQQLRAGLAALERALARIRQEVAIAQARGRTLTWGDWVSAGLGRLGRPARKRSQDTDDEPDGEGEAGGRRSIEARRTGIVARPADGSAELAIGFDALLLPGKATPHSRRKEAVREDARTKVDAAEDALRRTAETGTAVAGAAGQAVQEGQRVRSELIQGSGGVVKRWADDHWETDAFDLQ